MDEGVAEARWGVEEADFRGDPTVEAERGAVRDWVFEVPSELQDDMQCLTGVWRAVGVFMGYPMYEHNDMHTTLCAVPSERKWIMASDSGSLVWAWMEDDVDYAPQRGWRIPILTGHEKVVMGVKWRTADATDFKSDDDNISAEVKVEASDEPVEAVTDVMPTTPMVKGYRRGDNYEQSRGSAFQEAATHIGLPHTQRGQKRAMTPQDVPPPPPPLRPQPPQQPPPIELMQQHKPHGGGKGKGKVVQRGGWFNKAQDLCSAILESRWENARELAIKHYAKKNQLVLAPGMCRDCEPPVTGEAS